MPPSGGILVQLLAFLGALALLVGNAAAGLAGGLAGGLAFAAAAVPGAVAQVAGLDGLDVLHVFHLPFLKYDIVISLSYLGKAVNHIFDLSCFCGGGEGGKHGAEK